MTMFCDYHGDGQLAYYLAREVALMWFRRLFGLKPVRCPIYFDRPKELYTQKHRRRLGRDASWRSH